MYKRISTYNAIFLLRYIRYFNASLLTYTSFFKVNHILTNTNILIIIKINNVESKNWYSKIVIHYKFKVNNDNF